ncbi:MAG: histidine ammonia-lyase, partial [Halobacteriales archaeon]
MTVELDGESLSVDDVVAVARAGEAVAIPGRARERVRESRARVEDVLDSEEVVYGVNTGFGDLVDERVPPDDLERLQANLVRSHAAAVGDPLPRAVVRAMLVTRINALAKGFSGIRESVLDLLVGMVNEGVHPVVPERGSLGASGDLAPLAHVALVLIGEGEARYDGATDGPERGPRLDGEAALARADLEPATLQAKEGLALINGTQLTVGLAALLVEDAWRAVRAADAAGALTTEVTMGTTAACDPAIHRVRPHDGQRVAARNVRRLTADSGIVEAHANCDRVQDAYSIRCLPQVHGAVRDAVSHLESAVETELNSATDNPLVFAREQLGPDPTVTGERRGPADAVPGDAGRTEHQASGTERAAVLSGGNFHGEPLALRLDYLVSATTELAAIVERRIDRMLNPHVQEPHLPAFLTDRSGLRSGYMLAQYTAAALLNESRAIGRAAADSTPVSGNQEDHVSMSAGAALDARRAVDNAVTVVGIELLVAAQAAEFVERAPEVDAGAS